MFRLGAIPRNDGISSTVVFYLNHPTPTFKRKKVITFTNGKLTWLTFVKNGGGWKPLTPPP